MTREREALLRAALARRSHFTLDALVREVVRRDAPASRATVYRALPILIEAGIILPVLVSGPRRLFELAYGRRHHDHLLCRWCGRVVEFESEPLETAQCKVCKRHGFTLTGHVLELIGECPACQRAKARSRRGAERGKAAAPRPKVRTQARGARSRLSSSP
jgi:Fur family ferric uptake transcriptional regulator